MLVRVKVPNSTPRHPSTPLDTARHPSTPLDTARHHSTPLMILTQQRRRPIGVTELENQGCSSNQTWLAVLSSLSCSLSSSSPGSSSKLQLSCTPVDVATMAVHERFSSWALCLRCERELLASCQPLTSSTSHSALVFSVGGSDSGVPAQPAEASKFLGSEHFVFSTRFRRRNVADSCQAAFAAPAGCHPTLAPKNSARAAPSARRNRLPLRLRLPLRPRLRLPLALLNHQHQPWLPPRLRPAAPVRAALAGCHPTPPRRASASAARALLTAPPRAPLLAPPRRRRPRLPSPPSPPLPQPQRRRQRRHQQQRPRLRHRLDRRPWPPTAPSPPPPA